MKLGIIGLPQSGKTTVFNALTKSDIPLVLGGGKIEIHTGTVEVPDERLDRLGEIFEKEKVIHAQVTYADIGGYTGKASSSEISGQILNQLNQMDALVHVLRCFQSPTAPHMLGDINPKRDLEVLDNDLLINDLISVEKRQKKLQSEWMRGGGRDKIAVEKEIELFNKLEQSLSEGTSMRDLDLIRHEKDLLAGFNLLSQKPVLILLNLSEDQECPEFEYLHRRSRVVSLKGKLEMEIAQLSGDDRELFREEFGIDESGPRKIIRESYQLMGVHSFFTIGDHEVRSWVIQEGTTAWECAGIIHSDLHRGFIRAEVVNYDQLVEAGSMTALKKAGKMRLEGKEYEVKDGEIVQVRFHV